MPSDWDGPPPDEVTALFTAEQMRAYALACVVMATRSDAFDVAAAVAAERERIKAALLGMDDAVAGAHNYYAHAAWVLFERA